MQMIERMIAQAEEELRPAFAEIDENEALRMKQVLDAFRKEGVSYRHFAPSTGKDLRVRIPHGSRADAAACFQRNSSAEPHAFRTGQTGRKDCERYGNAL